MSVAPLSPVGSAKEAETEHTASASQSKQDSSFSFGEFLDIINPLQHIPGINTLYRELTGDEASVRARVAGSSLYGMIGGPLGMAGLVAGNVAEMKLSGVLDEATQQPEQKAATAVITEKISTKTIEPASDMTAPLQRGIPVIPVAKRDIPAMFGNIATPEIVSAQPTERLIETLDELDAPAAQQSTEPETLPGVEKLSEDPRNLLTEEALLRLREIHAKSISQNS